MNLRTWPRRYWAKFSFVGLAVATLLFAASLTPSLLPRHYLTQAILSGFALAVGYGLGVLAVWIWHYLEIPDFSDRTQGFSKRITTVVVAIIVCAFLWQAAIWQNSIRDLMEMEPVATAYPLHVGGIALVTAFMLIAIGRWIGWVWMAIDRRIKRYVPPRVARIISAALVLVLVVLIVNDVIAKALITAADAAFLKLDRVVDEGIEQPTADNATGSPDSLVEWDTIGRRGKDFIAAGPTQADISKFLGRDAEQPLRIYVGLDSRDTPEERAQLALDELKRVGGFDREVLIVATPTGTGWLDPGGVDTIEYLHGGDTAIVSMQYSYLPSWITILVDPTRSIEMSRALFDVIYEHWKELPTDDRPRLYLFGLSLGALGSAASADLFTVFEDPIHGAVWSGPPFPSAVWNRITAARDDGTPMWLPKFRDGSMIRFTGRESSIDHQGKRWGPMRFVFIEHASDPMVFFSPDSAWRRPQWLNGERGPDVSPYLRWVPLVTFLQTGFDLPMATTVPHGYGHNYAASSYIDAWIAVTAPPDWTSADTRRLKTLFAPAK
jgi:uncharacterized membrane protein